MASLGKHIRKARVDQGLSQKAVAGKLRAANMSWIKYWLFGYYGWVAVGLAVIGT